MKRIHTKLILCSFLFCLLQTYVITGFNCQFKDGGKYYDLEGLTRKDDYVVKNLQAGTKVGDLNFNFCKSANKPTECETMDSSAAYFVTPDGECYAMSINTDHLNEETTWEYVMGSHGPKIIGDNSKNKLMYSLKVNIHCAIIGQNRDNDMVKYNKETKQFEIKIYHFRGCGFYNYNFSFILRKIKWIICILGLIVGVYINMSGMRYYQFSLAMISSICVTFIVINVVYYLTGQSADPMAIIYLVVVPFNIGFFSLIFFYHNPLLGLVMEGFCFGIMANIMMKGLLMSIFLKLPSTAVNCFTNFFFMIIGSILALQVSRPFSLVAMSFIGAFLIIRCIGIFLENFPTEDDLEFDLRYGDDKQIPIMYYFYLCLTIALTFFGMLVQYLIDLLIHKGKVMKLMNSGTDSSHNMDLSLLNPTTILQVEKESSLDTGSSNSWIDEKTSFDDIGVVNNQKDDIDSSSNQNKDTDIETNKKVKTNQDIKESPINLDESKNKKSLKSESGLPDKIIQQNNATSFNESDFYNEKNKSESEIHNGKNMSESEINDKKQSNST